MPQSTEIKEHNVQIGMRLLENDESVLKDILKEFGPKISGFLCRKYENIFNIHDIEDVLAIAIFHLWQARKTYDERKGSVKTWFSRIADNAAKDVLKFGWQQAKMREVYLESGDYDKLFFSEHHSTADKSDNKNSQENKKLEELRKIIEALPEVQRRIVKADACARDGKASAEFLANELDIPIGTVRVYRKRAIDKIKEEFGRRGYKIP